MLSRRVGRCVSFFIMLLIAIVPLGLMPAQAAEAPSQDAKASTLTVPSSADWVNTGITVATNQVLHITATGSWSAGGGMTDGPVGPDGSSIHWGDNYLNTMDIGKGYGGGTTPTPHWGALIGYVGSSQPPGPSSYAHSTFDGAPVISFASNMFIVGSRYSHQAPSSGTLWLAFNDDAYSGYTVDNYGSVTASISLTAATQSPLTRIINLMNGFKNPQYGVQGGEVLGASTGPYQLPAPGGYQLEVSQGNCSPGEVRAIQQQLDQGNESYLDHCGSSYNGQFYDYYAWDFVAPTRESFPVVAAKGGTVVAERRDSMDNRCFSTSSCTPNFVVIREADTGYTDLYLHFAPGTIPTSIYSGQTVSQGQFLGLAGETGAASDIHLHFQVQGSQITVPPTPNGTTINCADLDAGNLSQCFHGTQWWFSSEPQSRVTAFNTAYFPIEPGTKLATQPTTTIPASFRAAPTTCTTVRGTTTCQRSRVSLTTPATGHTYISTNLAPFTWQAPTWWSHQYSSHDNLTVTLRANPLLDVSQWASYINVTLQNPTTKAWLTPCSHHGIQDTVTCSISLADPNYGVKRGQTLTLSFDVYDHDGNADLAPDGERTIWIRR